MESLQIALNAVLPFLIYMGLGYFTRISGIADETFISKLNQVIFQIFFPIMMFYNLYDRDPDLEFDFMLAAVSVLSVLGLILILCLLVPALVKENPRRGVLIQGIYRSNFVLFAVPLTESIFGSAGVAVASMLVAIIIPIYNVAAILVLEYFRGGKTSPAALAKKVLANPMIMGAIAGALVIFLQIRLPVCIDRPLSQLSAMTTPLALFVLGGTLRFSSMKRNLKYLIPAITVKLVLLPALALIIAFALSFPALERFVYFTMFATPAAAASYPMASNMGGDSALAGELVVLSTCASVITIFLWVFFMNTLGLL